MTKTLPRGMRYCAMHDVERCDMVISDRALMCGPHMLKVPRPLQVAFWRAFRRAPKGEPVKSQAYRVAVRACIEAVLLATGDDSAPHDTSRETTQCETT
jgi:hypothetical protein